LERRAGIEPANTGFADLRVSHFATGARKFLSGIGFQLAPLLLMSRKLAYGSSYVQTK
jgi:hypothetical protein